MLVSIVTPVLNAERFLRATLESVRGQDHAAIEHIVVDGGSRDGTVAILRQAPDVVWSSEPDAGMYDAINRGFRQAHGEILAYQNGDDRYASADAVSSVVEIFRTRPDVDVVYGDFRYVDEDGRPLVETPSPEFDLAALRRHNFVPPHSTFVRATVVQREGFWLDPGLRFAGDWEWFLRMATAGKRFVHIPRTLSEFRRHPVSLSQTVGWRVKLAEWRRVCARHGVSFASLVWHEALWEPLRKRGAGWRRLRRA
jgi:glycosyltransferase